MLASERDEIPKTFQEWCDKVTSRDLKKAKLHDKELASASKMGFDQFLLLRVIWKTHKRNITNVPDIKYWIREAEKKLRSYQSWSTFCDGLGIPEPHITERSGEPSRARPEGNFAIVKYYHQEVEKTKPQADPETFDTPIASRTRAKTNPPLVRGMKGMTLEDPQTPSRESRKPSGDISYDFDNKTSPPFHSRIFKPEDDESPGSSPSSDPSPPNTISREMDRILYPPTRDEQIVNTALIVFLNALTMHFDFYSNWTLHRKPFIATFENAQFEARTDGYLDSPGGKTRAIIEVKPVTRKLNMVPIRMQESAQMVAWIKSDDDLAQRTNNLRLHIAQDRHELWVTVAKYEEEYLEYLSDKKAAYPDDTSSFLIMNQYGPWDITKKSDMKEIGAILLAITLRAEREIKDEIQIEEKIQAEKIKAEEKAQAEEEIQAEKIKAEGKIQAEEKMQAENIKAAEKTKPEIKAKKEAKKEPKKRGKT
ncbi:uncharacterized protein N7518_009082 [Penicillium psychrosexuale]|uniref:uncharacterized protein n=1 Tax=Penicillium psychrosexuale TaxID=1002107 RepID=UPI002545617A|nr:uncharacterized protein N7518_009082 [Penicillium psychrosexuale]KAJ5783405.1 hypothetical protein N7518_009082 [Penicillium psychrosexuale]